MLKSATKRSTNFVSVFTRGHVFHKSITFRSSKHLVNYQKVFGLSRTIELSKHTGYDFVYRTMSAIDVLVKNGNLAIDQVLVPEVICMKVVPPSTVPI